MLKQAHAWHEDLFAMVTSIALTSLGIVLFKQSGLTVGGTVGLSLLLSKVSPWSFGIWFSVINFPFYCFALRRMGWVFVVKTAVTVSAVAYLGDHLGQFIRIDQIEPLYGALAGGLMSGVGLIILFRHQASMGGFNILCIWLQEHLKLPAGKIQMAMDCTVVLSSFFITNLQTLAVSVVAAIVMNAVLAINYKPGRYHPTLA
jgi:uncharacterized membrane-anchored protein YitT (DUF2179 family)